MASEQVEPCAIACVQEAIKATPRRPQYTFVAYQVFQLRDPPNSEYRSYQLSLSPQRLACSAYGHRRLLTIPIVSLTPILIDVITTSWDGSIFGRAWSVAQATGPRTRSDSSGKGTT